MGESGLGKSVSVKSIMRLFDEDGFIRYRGQVLLEGRKLLDMDKTSFKDVIKTEISMVFQDPFESLNPLFTIEYQLVEAIETCGKWKGKDHVEIAKKLLARCGIKNPESCLKSFPYQLSGGMRQRIMIAMAISKLPKVLIADEPTTALDVTIQAEILKLFLELRKENDMSLLFITHDLSVVRDISDRILVMYLGEAVSALDISIQAEILNLILDLQKEDDLSYLFISHDLRAVRHMADKIGVLYMGTMMEEAEGDELFERSLNPYTRMLVYSIPGESLKEVPTDTAYVRVNPKGCPFEPRCEMAGEICKSQKPVLRNIYNRRLACHMVD